MAVMIVGVDDDQIHVSGDVVEQFDYAPNGDGQYVALSDGAVIHIELDDAGQWKLTPYQIPQEVGVVRTLAKPGEESDLITVEGTVHWAMLGDFLVVRDDEWAVTW